MAPNKHLLELTEEVFPAQDRHASNRALVQACREIESGFIPGWRSLGKGGGGGFLTNLLTFSQQTVVERKSFVTKIVYIVDSVVDFLSSA